MKKKRKLEKLTDENSGWNKTAVSFKNIERAIRWLTIMTGKKTEQVLFGEIEAVTCYPLPEIFFQMATEARLCVIIVRNVLIKIY